jgi:hypothetical protein
MVMRRFVYTVQLRRKRLVYTVHHRRKGWYILYTVQCTA